MPHILVEANVDGYTIKNGERIKNFGGWYRHDKVILNDGKELDGGIQVKTDGRGGLNYSTFFEDKAVAGSQPQWLIRMNREAEDEVVESE